MSTRSGNKDSVYDCGSDGQQEGFGSLQLAYARRKSYKNQRSSTSPPLTEDSGQWSSSFPSSPIKEQSPHGSTSTNKHVKSSSGSTSSCEYNSNGVKKSDLYGTPHWWPVEQERYEEEADHISRGKIRNKPVNASRNDNYSAEVECGGVTSVFRNRSRESEMTTTSETVIVKTSKALAFTINFDDNIPADDVKMSMNGVHSLETEKMKRGGSGSGGEGFIDIAPVEDIIDLSESVEESVVESITDDIGVAGAVGTSDVKSDNGTYTLDDDDSSNVERRSTDIPVTEIDNSEWIQKWATEASAHVPDVANIPPYDDTFKILDETRNIVNAIQNRVSSSSGTVDPKKMVKQKPELPSSIKFNRAFNIRRNLNTNNGSSGPAVMSNSHHSYDSDTPMSTSSLISDKYTGNNNFSRADGGRFSLRVKKGTNGSFSDTEIRNFPYGSIPKKKESGAPQSSRPLTNSPVRSKSILGPSSVNRGPNSHYHPNNINNNTNPGSGNQKLQTRSNSTITSRDIEMENWKRRKSYDPLKSSGMGITNKSLSKIEDIKKREVNSPSGNGFGGGVMSGTPSNIKSNVVKVPNTASSTSSLSRLHHKRNPSNATVGLGLMSGSMTEYEATPSTSASSIQSFSPTPPPFDHNCCGDYARMHDWMAIQQQLNRSSCETSPRKFEALDTLVISTIFSLTNKVRNLSLGLLKKIQPNQEDDENSALIEEMITQLKELSTAQSGEKQGQKSSSKELSGILKNVKKIEQVILVLDRVLCEDEDDDGSSG